MRDFNQEIKVKKFEVNLQNFSFVRLGNIIYSTCFYSVSFRHNWQENYDRLLIGLDIKPHSEETKSVEIRIYSYSTFNNETNLTFQELDCIFEKSIFVLNEALVSKLKEISITIPHPALEMGMMSYELSIQYQTEYQS